MQDSGVLEHRISGCTGAMATGGGCRLLPRKERTGLHRTLRTRKDQGAPPQRQAAGEVLLRLV